MSSCGGASTSTIQWRLPELAVSLPKGAVEEVEVASALTILDTHDERIEMGKRRFQADTLAGKETA